MKATLHFELPEEQEEFHYAANAIAFRGQVDDFDMWLRSVIRDEEPGIDNKTAQKIRDQLHELVEFERV